MKNSAENFYFQFFFSPTLLGTGTRAFESGKYTDSLTESEKNHDVLVL